MTYKEALAICENLDTVFIPYELAEGMDKTKELIGRIEKGQSVGIFIGPEGGFEKEEVEQAMEMGQSRLRWENVYCGQKLRGLLFCQS